MRARPSHAGAPACYGVAVPHRVLHALSAASVAEARALLGLLQLERQLPQGEPEPEPEPPDPVLAGPLSSRGPRRVALLKLLASLPQQPGSRRRTVRFAPAPPALESLLEGKAGPAPVWVELDLELAKEPAGRLVLALDQPYTSEEGYCLVYTAAKRNDPRLELFRRWLLTEAGR